MEDRSPTRSDWPTGNLTTGSQRRNIYLYLGALTILLTFAAPYGALFDLPISFLLKNKLGLTAHEVASFRLIAGLPIYFAGVFGLLRDVWNPFGMKDRGLLILFGTIGSGLYLCFGLFPMSRDSLLIAVLTLTTVFLFANSALNGLAGTLAQQHFMAGRVSAAWNVCGAVPIVVSYAVGGMFSDLLESRQPEQALHMLFLAGALVMAAIAVFGCLKPSSVFSHSEPPAPRSAVPFIDIGRLLRHWPIYPALLIWFLWCFSPGAATPLQYYMQNTLHGADTDWGKWNAIFAFFGIPTTLIYGFVCRHISIKWLLIAATLAAIPEYVPLLFIDTLQGAMIMAIPIGLMSGAATTAYIDLLIRTCPRGFHGAILMLSIAFFHAGGRAGDMLGATIYDKFGDFFFCVLAVTITYCLVLPVVFLLPKEVLQSRDL